MAKVTLKGGRSYSRTPTIFRSRPIVQRSLTVGVDFSMTGDKALDRNLRQLIRNVSDETLENALLKAAAPLVSTIKVRTHSKSGALRRSVNASTELSPRQKSLHSPIDPVEVFVGYGPLPYAHMYEFGTSHQRAFPTLRPAWEQGKLPLFNRLVAILKSAVMRKIR